MSRRRKKRKPLLWLVHWVFYVSIALTVVATVLSLCDGAFIDTAVCGLLSIIMAVAYYGVLIEGYE